VPAKAPNYLSAELDQQTIVSALFLERVGLTDYPPLNRQFGTNCKLIESRRLTKYGVCNG
jgi:hypothetical protein